MSLLEVQGIQSKREIQNEKLLVAMGFEPGYEADALLSKIEKVPRGISLISLIIFYFIIRNGIMIALSLIVKFYQLCQKV